ncbi:hypothetical protein GW17_00022839 [Ensete ventricosum]|nr:hypothetical protein GW17_00022839 [Ensete ventricosum]
MNANVDDVFRRFWHKHLDRAQCSPLSAYNYGLLSEISLKHAEDEDNEFYIQSKKNMCVGCGEKSHYIRYRIIPSCYRIHFPEHLKSHRSHDIVLLCVDCHEVAHSAAEKYKKKVAQEFGIPLFVQKIVNLGESTVATVASTSVNLTEETGVSPLQLRIAAMALLRHGSNMPSGRLEELMQVRTFVIFDTNASVAVFTST